MGIIVSLVGHAHRAPVVLSVRLVPDLFVTTHDAISHIGTLDRFDAGELHSVRRATAVSNVAPRAKPGRKRGNRWRERAVGAGQIAKAPNKEVMVPTGPDGNKRQCRCNADCTHLLISAPKATRSVMTSSRGCASSPADEACSPTVRLRCFAPVRKLERQHPGGLWTLSNNLTLQGIRFQVQVTGERFRSGSRGSTPVTSASSKPSAKGSTASRWAIPSSPSLFRVSQMPTGQGFRKAVGCFASNSVVFLRHEPLKSYH
jgi:hypothetical protein